MKQHFSNPHRLLDNFYPKIVKIEPYITNSEIEALILEQKLIKKYLPVYNVLWKDDKSYPYICLTNEEFPRLIYLRNPKILNNNTIFFGPFPDGFWAKKLLNFLNSQLPFRKCLKLPKTSCIFYDLGQCWAPCINKGIKSENYKKLEIDLINFFSKKDSRLLKILDKMIQESSNNLQFEQAKEYLELKNKIKLLLSSQLIETKTTKNFHVITWIVKDNFLGITIYFFYCGSFFSQTQEIFLIKTNWFDELQLQLTNIYLRNILPDFFISHQEIKGAWFFTQVKNKQQPKIICPKKGNFKKLLKLVEKNNQFYFDTNIQTKIIEVARYEEGLNHLKSFLNQKEINHIDFVDTSHHNGINYVGAVISFKNNQFFWSNFRKFNLEKIITSSNDLLAIKETLRKKYLDANQDSLVYPDLVIIDGGKEQLKTAIKTLKCLIPIIRVVSVSKDEKHRSFKLWVSPDREAILLSTNKNLKNFISQLQDKAHNYAISYFRKLSSPIKYKI